MSLPPARTTCPRCGATFPAGRTQICLVCLAAESSETGPVLVAAGAIELEDEIGRGGMGVVYRGRHLALGRTVAVKYLSSELGKDPEFRARFEREARALGRLEHPGIVRVHDFGDEDGEEYLVLEYVDGGALANSLPLPPRRALEVARDVAGALEYAHSQGIVHRDIKPQNILLDRLGRAKLTDFGIARLVAAKGEIREPEPWTLTAAGMVLGTPHYMAPEALEGARPEPRMDLYSLGVVLHEMATGRLPVGAYDPAPEPLGSIVKRALAPQPERRYPNAREMLSDLERALASSEGPELAAEEKTWLRAAALAFTIATAAVLWAFVQSVTPRTLSAREVEELGPLRLGFLERGADGSYVSRGRFELELSLFALAAVSVALVAFGFLRRHWRAQGLDRPDPERSPIQASGRVLFLGVAAFLLFLARVAVVELGYSWAMAVSVLVGGSIEVAVVFFVWVAILEALRLGRPLAREAKLWIGLGIALVPPALVLARHIFGGSGP